MFGHKSKPSKIYRYGARVPLNLDIIDQEMHTMRKYKNNLIELELARRKEIDEVRNKMYPALSELIERCEQIKEAIEEKRNILKQKNQEARKKVQDVAIKADITLLKNELKSISKAVKELRTKVKEDENLKEAWSRVDGASRAKKLRLRAASGLYWGNKQIVELTVKKTGKPPRFRRWDGSGRIAVQIQKGISPAEVLAGTNTQLRVQCLENKKAIAHIRIGSNGIKPIWVQVPFKMHRPLPADCMIKMAWLIRKKVGTHFKWELQFIVSKDNWAKETTGKGLVAIDVGWRTVKDGLRVCCWEGEDGQTGEIVIGHERLRSWDKVEELQSIRDKNFNSIKDLLIAWMYLQDLPDWFTDETKTIMHWRSQSRLAKFTLTWRNNRFEDDDFFNQLESWRKQDKHLYDWQEHQRKHNLAWRDDFYRNIFNDLAQKYEELVFEDVNWAVLQETSDIEEDEKEISVRRRSVASVGRMISLAKEQFIKHIAVDHRNTSKQCPHCGIINDPDRKSQFYTCECGHMIDPDRAAPKNLLARAKSVKSMEMIKST